MLVTETLAKVMILPLFLVFLFVFSLSIVYSKAEILNIGERGREREKKFLDHKSEVGKKRGEKKRRRKTARCSKYCLSVSWCAIADSATSSEDMSLFISLPASLETSKTWTK